MPGQGSRPYRAFLRKKEVSDIELSRNSEKVFRFLKDFDKRNNLIWLNRTSLNNAFVLLTNQKFAKKHNLYSISDLARHINKKKPIKFGSIQSFLVRQDGFKRLGEHYGFLAPLGGKILGHTAVYKEMSWEIEKAGFISFA